MSNGVILTSGYINLDTAITTLLDANYDVVDLYGLLQNDRCIDEHDIIEAYINKELERDGFKLGDGNTASKRSLVDMDMLSLFSLGGKYFKDDMYFMGIMDNELSASISKANAAYKYIMERHKVYNFKAALLHADSGPVWRSVALACSKLGIPVFVCYNGAITECVPKYSALSYYSVADVYYLHGEYAEDWLRRRYEYTGGYPVVGQPSFDSYYPIDEQEGVEEAVFLYNSKTVFSKYEELLSGLWLLLDKAQISMLATKLPSDMDEKFFSAFAKFQKEVATKDSLIVSLRPYHSSSREDYTNYISEFGINNFRVVPYKETPIRELIPKARYVVTGTSTVAIEGMVNRKGVVLLPGNSDYQSYRFENEWAVNPANMEVDAIVESLYTVVESEETLIDKCNKYAPYFNYGDDGKAGKRLVEDLIRRIE